MEKYYNYTTNNKSMGVLISLRNLLKICNRNLLKQGWELKIDYYNIVKLTLEFMHISCIQVLQIYKAKLRNVQNEKNVLV